MREKELRLALVCYGGISLAVYMHGITKEAWRLARASRAFTAGEPPAAGVEGIYHALLAEGAKRSGVSLRVLVDIIAGASAGGLNGVFLAQAITSGQSLDPLTDLWLTSADIEALTDPEAAPRGRMSKLWALPIAWLAGRGDPTDALEEEPVREEVRAKLSRFIRSRWFEPPFGGARFTGLILDALDAMAAGPPGPRLLPDGQPLDLFVTVTDFTGHPELLTLHSPAKVIETEHRLVIRFTDEGGTDATLADAAELAFAGRATSSFPGAFPPFTVGELDRVLVQRGRRWPGRRGFLRRVLPRQFAAGTAEKTVLIDGSVLANAPFRPAIDAIRGRPARRQVDRRFVYVDPSPGMKVRLTHTDGPPSFLQTILGAVSELPRQQPIRDNLEAIAERSARIERMRGIVLAIRPEVEAEIAALFGATLFLDRPTPGRLAAWRARAQEAAARKAGYGYAGYGHLKIAGVIDWLARLMDEIGGNATAGTERIARAADGIRAHGLGEHETSLAGGADARTIAFLRRFDIGFRLRRLRLLARRLGELDAAEAAAALGPLREAIYGSLATYIERERPAAHASLRSRMRAPGRGLARTIDALGTSLDLVRLDAATDERLAGALATLPDETRRPMLLTYLGFPFYDVATLPLLQGEGLDEYDPIRVDRIAPDDATAIRSGGAEATLKGIQFNSFGAFFSRAYRENDYLWGRLHGADRLIDIVVSALPPTGRLRAARVAAIKRAAFLAILDEEEPRLTRIAGLFTTLRREIGSL